MTPLATGFLLVGLILGAIVLVRVLTAGDGTWVTKRPAVRVHPKLLEEMREEIVFNAIKDHKVRTGYQKGNPT